MAIFDRDTIKTWFKRNLYPLEIQFSNWIDSFWHKNDLIPVSSIESLQQYLDAKVDKKNLVQATLYNPLIAYVFDSANQQYVSYQNASSSEPQFQTEGFYRLKENAAIGESPETDVDKWAYQGAYLGNIAIQDVFQLPEVLEELANNSGGGGDDKLDKDFSTFTENSNPALTSLFASFTGAENEASSLLAMLVKSKGFVKIKNQQGQTITQGKYVVAVGYDEQEEAILVQLADNTDPSKLGVLGYIQADVNADAYGIASTRGLNTGLDTNGGQVGSCAYLSTVGGTTPTEPASNVVKLGTYVVINNATGQINTNIQCPSSASSGGGTPAGSEGDIQRNISGAFGANSDLNYSNDLLKVAGGLRTTAKTAVIQELLELLNDSAESLFSVSSEGVISLKASIAGITTELGVLKMYYNDVTEELIMSTSVGDYTLNKDRVLTMKDMNYGVPLDSSMMIYSSSEEKFNQILTVEDVSQLTFGESNITVAKELNDVIQDGYQLITLSVSNTSTASASALFGTTAGASDIAILTVPPNGEEVFVNVATLSIAGFNGVDQSIFVDCASFTDVNLTVIQLHQKFR